MGTKYETILTKGLEGFNEACNKLAQIAINNELHAEHVSYAQDVIKARTAELKKQLEYKPPKVEISLPSLGGSKPKHSPTSSFETKSES